jgi:DNA-binding NarL/FixJ family response regulator
MNAIRLLLVDDNVSFLSTLKEFLSGEDDMAVVGEATDGYEALDSCARLQPDVVVMDLFMPQYDGLQATRSLLSDCPGSRVVVITGQEEPQLRLLSMQAGAADFVTKPQIAVLLREAIRRVARGEAPDSPATGDRGP